MIDLTPGARKQCGMCHELKALSDFHRFGDGHQSYCKPCRRSGTPRTGSGIGSTASASRKERRLELREWLRHLKNSTPCADCRKSLHWSAMTYDHLPGNPKRGNVSDLVKGGYRSVLIAEIAKCDLICASCHAVRTYLRTLGIEPTQPSICEPPAIYAKSTAPLN